MNHHDLAQLEDTIDKLQHTRRCESEALYEGKHCICGAEDLREACVKYKHSCWEENRER